MNTIGKELLKLGLKLGAVAVGVMGVSRVLSDIIDTKTEKLAEDVVHTLFAKEVLKRREEIKAAKTEDLKMIVIELIKNTVESAPIEVLEQLKGNIVFMIPKNYVASDKDIFIKIKVSEMASIKLYEQLFSKLIKGY